MSTGWTCPVCGAGVAPTVATCPCVVTAPRRPPTPWPWVVPPKPHEVYVGRCPDCGSTGACGHVPLQPRVWCADPRLDLIGPGSCTQVTIDGSLTEQTLDRMVAELSGGVES